MRPDEQAGGKTDHAIDLFCGVGGLTQGLGRAGIDVVMGVDLDPACRYAFEANNAAAFVNADVMQLRAEDLAVAFTAKEVLLLAGCAPCQPFSTYSAVRSEGDAESRKATAPAIGHCCAGSAS